MLQKQEMQRNQHKTNKQRDRLWVNLINTCPAPISHHIQEKKKEKKSNLHKEHEAYFRTLFVTLFSTSIK